MTLLQQEYLAEHPSAPLMCSSASYLSFLPSASVQPLFLSFPLSPCPANFHLYNAPPLLSFSMFLSERDPVGYCTQVYSADKIVSNRKTQNEDEEEGIAGSRHRALGRVAFPSSFP
eukprot:2124177-Rhodomonas_salina.1